MPGWGLARTVPHRVLSALAFTPQSLAGIEAASNRPFAFGTSGVNTNTLAGIMAASSRPSVTVNFNGVATDPEGTARVLVDTLNNSFYRGTGGANSLQFA